MNRQESDAMALDVQSTGLARGTPPEPCVLVVFGASGDLAHRKLFPALYSLHRQRLLPDPLSIIGFARGEWDDDGFGREMHSAVSKVHDVQQDQWRSFAANLSFVRGDFNAPASADYARLRQRIEQARSERDLPDNVLFHLATPPSLYGVIAERLAAAKLIESSGGWRRMAIEKPFGQDESSARQLDQKLHSVLHEEQLFRVDHYLGKETVQNMLAFRFANPGFEPIWNRDHIDHVQITAAESVGIGSRGAYYDRTGVVRDMVQNHLLQLLCMTAMDPPVSYDAISLRNETFKVLQAVRPLDLARDCVLGQYGAGEIDGHNVPGYRQQEHVDRNSKTPTFAAIRFSLDNWRWSGVPFYLRSGKRLPRKVTEITIHFKPTPHLMFAPKDPARLRSNTLTFRLQPEEGIFHRLLAKQPGPEFTLQPVTMRFCYDAAFGIEELPGAYEWLLLDEMQGDQTLFPRSDWIYKAWSIVDPLVERHESAGDKGFPNYAAGAWGPTAADELLKRDGRAWQVE
jgi:glucose-6-phosphate 1-dehydrogenase